MGSHERTTVRTAGLARTSSFTDRVRRNWDSSVSTIGGSERVRKKILTLFLYFMMIFIMSAIYVGTEYQNDRHNRIFYKSQLHEYVKEISDLHNAMDVVDWRYFAKTRIDEIVQLNYHLGIGPNYRVEAWNYVNAFVFCVSTTTTIGYGYPSPHTVAGRIITIILCITGIPFAFMALTDFVDLVLVLEKFIWLMVKKKGMKPISTLQNYGRRMSVRFTSSLNPLIDISAASSSSEVKSDDNLMEETVNEEEQVSVKKTELNPKSTKQSRESRHSESNDNLMTNNKEGPMTKKKHCAAMNGTPSSDSESKQQSSHGDNAKSAMASEAMLSDAKVSSHSSSASSRLENTSCWQNMLSCFHENCCEDLSFSNSDMEEEDEEEVEDEVVEQPKFVPIIPPPRKAGRARNSMFDGQQTFTRMQFNTGTVRRMRPSSSESGSEIEDKGLSSRNPEDDPEDNNLDLNDSPSITPPITEEDLPPGLPFLIEAGEGMIPSHDHTYCENLILEMVSSMVMNVIGAIQERLACDSILPTTSTRPQTTLSNTTAASNIVSTVIRAASAEIANYQRQHEALERNTTPVRTQQVTEIAPHPTSGSYVTAQDLTDIAPDPASGNIMRMQQVTEIAPHPTSGSNVRAQDLTDIATDPASRNIVRTQEVTDIGPQPASRNNNSNTELQNIQNSKTASETPVAHVSVIAAAVASTSQMVEAVPGQPSEPVGEDAVHFEFHNLFAESETEVANSGDDLSFRNTNANTNKVSPGMNNDSMDSIFRPHPHPRSSSSNSLSDFFAAIQTKHHKRSLDRMSRVTISSLMEEEVETDTQEVSLAITFLNLLLYIFLGALIYVFGENWDYLTAVYYIFTSISTIGFGDVMPQGGTALFFWSSLYILCGLAFLAKIIHGIRGAMLKFMLASVSKVEQVGMKMAGTISAVTHSFVSHMNIPKNDKKDKSDSPMPQDSLEEVLVREDDIIEGNSSFHHLVEKHDKGINSILAPTSDSDDLEPDSLLNQNKSRRHTHQNLHVTFANVTFSDSVKHLSKLQLQGSKMVTKVHSSIEEEDKMEQDICLSKTDSLRNVCSDTLLDTEMPSSADLHMSAPSSPLNISDEDDDDDDDAHAIVTHAEPLKSVDLPLGPLIDADETGINLHIDTPDLSSSTHSTSSCATHLYEPSLPSVDEMEQTEINVNIKIISPEPSVQIEPYKMEEDKQDDEAPAIIVSTSDSLRNVCSDSLLDTEMPSSVYLHMSASSSPSNLNDNKEDNTHAMVTNIEPPSSEDSAHPQVSERQTEANKTEQATLSTINAEQHTVLSSSSIRFDESALELPDCSTIQDRGVT